MKNIVLVTGGFDPIHSGHIAYFKAARTLGDMLIVGLNSDEWLERKKGKKFMDLVDRQAVVDALKYVDKVITFDDADNTAIEAIRTCLVEFPEDTIVFANGGDRKDFNTPEGEVCRQLGITMLWGIGGDKIQSSSWLLAEAAKKD